MPNPPGPAPKRDLSGAWVGPGTSNKPDPVPPMTPAGEAILKQRKAYNIATESRERRGRPSRSVERPGHHLRSARLPRNVLTYAITNRGGVLFGSAPNRILIAYEQQPPLARDLDGWPRATQGRRREGAPESRYYGYSVGRWENDNTLRHRHDRFWTNARGWTRWDIRAAPWRTFRSVTRASINTTYS